jgi:hypothetical protein
LQIETVDEPNEDVIRGMLLYRELSGGPATDAIVRQRWPYWFTENPFASGVCSVAKAGGEVVGLSTMIPVRMRFGERGVIGAKGEFVCVRPEFRRAIDTDTGQAAPIALVARTKRRVAERGMAANFSVPTEGAMTVTRLTGGRPLDVAATRYLTRFVTLRGATAKDRLRQLGVGLVEAPRRLRKWGGLDPSVTIEPIDRFEDAELPDPAAGHHLIDPEATMLNFRFPSQYYLKWRVRRDSVLVGHVVLTQPGARPGGGPGRIVEVMHWAYWPGEAAALRTALAQSINAAAKAKARGWRIELASPDAEALQLTALGLRGRASRPNLALTTQDSGILQAAQNERWRLTASHRGFYQHMSEMP